MKKRVVVTGLGIVSPIGNNKNDYFSSLKEGTSGIKKISLFDTTNFDVHIAGEVEINLENHFERKEINKLDRYSAFALIAAKEAINESNLLNNHNIDPNDIGVIVGSGIGGISTFEEQHSRLLKSPRRVSPFFIPSMISDIAAGQISIKYGFKGPNYGVVSACATGSHAIGDSFRTIQYEDAKIIIAGGSEASISPISIAGFSNMKALTKNPDIHSASIPFDNRRNGFVIGEGAGILVLEELNHALDRGANIIAEIIGYGATADAYHLTSPDPDGIGASQAMNKAINDAKIKPQEINYINAHGTSTPLNDKFETYAIKNTFGNFAHDLHISSTKSMTGHLLGAAGAIEAIASIYSIKNGIIPPTINYAEKDSECDLNYTPNQHIIKDVNYAMSNNFGFGGHNASLIFKKYLNN